jgi:hypothetical protein
MFFRLGREQRMSAFDFEATARGQRREIGAALDQLRLGAPQLIRVDAATGQVETSPDGVHKLMVNVTPGAPGQALADSLLAYAAAGFVNLGARGRGEPILIPWLALEDLAARLKTSPRFDHASIARPLSRRMKVLT